ncbi:CHY zinc finger protein [Niallia sp. NCCP-28]|uniref:CHY zinc finger protein n=1 Tax=Niallia sp. NCCP-28 TaxID=2934712 RepID=UPI00208B77A8|nr:CHY zinc finger protein [Niallia sp. NCCP-28]GKU80819.1 hypothetical protein NCCP28_02150 [Niallia sp. NCCP-28]
MKKIFGFPVDKETRCIHYHGEVDVIAIKFFCCNHYYPCYKCHEEEANHPIKRWPKQRFDEKAILCGVCKMEHTINAYKNMKVCSNCGAKFNDRCELHYPLYFEEEK